MKKIKLSSIEKDNNLILQYDEIKGVAVQLMSTKETLSNSNEKIRFLKKCESNVRKSKRYKAYKLRLLKKGINMCAVFGNIKEENAILEMHHGPIFTLWDYVEITVNYLYSNGYPLNTFDVANLILSDHFEDLIQVVMVSETVHKMIHTDDKIKIPLESAWGDLVGYLEKYKGCLSPKHFAKLNNYLELPILNKDFDIIKTKIEKWKDIKLPEKIPSLSEIRNYKKGE